MKAGLMLAVNPNAKRQPEDFYATDPWAIYKSKDFLQSTLCKEVWEPACGQGHLADALKELGFKVRASDIIDRNYPNTEVIDFLSENNNKTWDGDILTNPPFKYLSEFVKKSVQILTPGHKAIFFLKIQALETKSRAELFKSQGLKQVVVHSERVCCAMDGEFDKYFKYHDGHYYGGTQLFAWYVFEKDYKGSITLDFI